MEEKKSEKITIAFYKGYKRYLVLNIPLKKLVYLVTTNAILLLAFLIFFTAFIFQWTGKWRMMETNKALKKEIMLLKK
jgi:hypothetical protein